MMYFHFAGVLSYGLQHQAQRSYWKQFIVARIIFMKHLKHTYKACGKVQSIKIIIMIENE